MNEDKHQLLNFHDDEEMEIAAEEAEQKRKSQNPIKSMLPDNLKTYWKTFVLAFFLLISGVSFLLIAIYIISLPETNNGPHSYVFFLCGFICIIPGGYHVVYIYFASKGTAGYNLEELRTFQGE